MPIVDIIYPTTATHSATTLTAPSSPGTHTSGINRGSLDIGINVMR